MYLTRLTLLDHPDLKAVLHHLADAYCEHQMLWQVFDADADTERDFLYRRDAHRGRPRYFVLSQRPPVNPLGLWRIDPPKPFEPRLHQGQRLAFMLRANPVVTRDGKRHDIVMDRKRQLNWKSLPVNERPPLPELIPTAGLAWLRQRADRHGFTFDDDAIRVEGYHQHRTRRSNRDIRFSTLDFTGLLIVTHPDAFLQSLRQGIGPAKAFGCGLMLVRRV
jgi:CRISPR system Cascade subunit CasE